MGRTRTNGPRSVAPAIVSGLTDEEAARRLATTGPNPLPNAPTPTLGRLVVRQLAEPLTLVLVVVATATLVVLRQVPEGLATAAIVVLNTVIGVSQEGRAQAAVEALERLTAPTARVRRGGRSPTVSAMEVVPGDLVELAAGDRVTADLTLVESASLAVDEALLTGESLFGRQGDRSDRCLRATLGDRRGEAFAGRWWYGDGRSAW